MRNRPIYNGKILASLFVVTGMLLMWLLVSRNQNGPIPLDYSATNSTTPTPTPVSSNTSPVAAAILIFKNDQGNLIFKPQTITIKQGDEVFIGNNDTSPHSLTNGIGSNDPLSGNYLTLELLNQKILQSL
jgi:hypothetical protein